MVNNKLFSLKVSVINLNRLETETYPDAGIIWKCNPPAAPHVRGSWERLVRSVKKTLAANMAIKDQAMNNKNF